MSRHTTLDYTSILPNLHGHRQRNQALLDKRRVTKVLTLPLCHHTPCTGSPS
eukprot:COSAG02_NODE_31613_length_530_cov_1.406032_1_plen_51_part_01